HTFPTNSLTSVTLPVIAAAAALRGLAKNVLDFGPCLPSKFRFDVEIQYFPAGTLSSFIPRHAEHPGLRNSKPAVSKILSRPSLRACSSTCLDPGMIHTSTLAAFFLPFTMEATRRRSSIRALVQLPINT